MVRVSKAILAGVLALSLAAMPGCTTRPTTDDDRATREVLDMDDKITERDIEVARSLGAPEDVLASMREGEWPSTRSKKNVRYAELAEDHLSARYGETFRATETRLSAGLMRDPHTVTCAVETGEHAGETCVASVLYTDDPRWADNYLYLRLHGEYERRLTAAAQEAFGDLPEGSWVMEAEMLDKQYPNVDTDPQGVEREVPPDATLKEAGVFVSGHLWVFVSSEGQLPEKDFDARAERMRDALDALDVRVIWSVDQITRPLDDAELTVAWAREALDADDYSWSVTGNLLGDE